MQDSIVKADTGDVKTSGAFASQLQPPVIDKSKSGVDPTLLNPYSFGQHVSSFGSMIRGEGSGALTSEYQRRLLAAGKENMDKVPIPSGVSPQEIRDAQSFVLDKDTKGIEAQQRLKGTELLVEEQETVNYNTATARITREQTIHAGELSQKHELERLSAQNTYDQLQLDLLREMANLRKDNIDAKTSAAHIAEVAKSKAIVQKMYDTTIKYSTDYLKLAQNRGLSPEDLAAYEDDAGQTRDLASHSYIYDMAELDAREVGDTTGGWRVKADADWATYVDMISQRKDVVFTPIPKPKDPEKPDSTKRNPFKPKP